MCIRYNDKSTLKSWERCPINEDGSIEKDIYIAGLVRQQMYQ